MGFGLADRSEFPGGEDVGECSRQEEKVFPGPKRRQPSRLSGMGLSKKAIQDEGRVLSLVLKTVKQEWSCAVP